MAQATKYPVTDRVRAPERESSAHQALRAYSIFVMMSALAYSWWFNLLGAAGAAILVGGIIVASLAIWIPSLARRSLDRRSEEHTSELQSRENLVCRLLLEKKKKKQKNDSIKNNSRLRQ